MWSWLEKALYGPAAPYKGSNAVALYEVAPAPVRSSWVFDSHIQESASGRLPQSVSSAWDENEARGIDASMRSWQGLTSRERKEILLGIYLANPWVSACVDVIAKRITSGGLSIEAVEEGKGDQRHYDQLMEFLLRVNDDWDFLQYVRISIADELIFGETYTETVYKNGLPFQLYPVDCITMGYRIDRTGRVLRYEQQLSSTSEINKLDPKTIIRWWQPHPKSKVDPFSPIERVQDAVLIDKKMVNWVTTFFQKGAKAPYYIKTDMEKDEAVRFKTYYEQNFTGEKNAHLPPITYGGAEFVEFKAGAIDIDFGAGRDRNRTEILSAYSVPPAVVGLIESGNIGGGTGEDQEKSFQYNTCDPVKHAFFEKFNDRITKRGFGILDYRVSTRYADYRNDKDLADVQDKRIRNGSITINESRQEMGKKPYEDGGDVAIVVASKDIIPVPRFDDMEGEQKTNADLDIEAKQVANEKAKEPPPVVPPDGMQPPQGGNQPEKPGEGDGKKGSNKIAPKPKKPEGESLDEETAQPASHSQSDARIPALTQAAHAQASVDAFSALRRAATTEAGQDHSTGMMLAFMLDAQTAKQLAIPGGEAPENLHITLAYLGDMEDDAPTDGTLRPDTSPFKIRDAISMIASEAKPLSGVVGGVGRFRPAETDTTPIIALVDVPGLVEFRTKLVQTVQSAGYNVADNHGYTPHITLDYIDASAPMPIEDVPALPLTLDTVTLCVGDQRFPFRLGDEQYPQYWDDKGQVKESIASASTLADDLMALWREMQKRGNAQLTPENAKSVYRFTHEDEQRMVDLLVDAYTSSRKAAYSKAFATIGLPHVTTEALSWPKLPGLEAAKQWAQDQVSSIVSTFEETFSSAVDALTGTITDMANEISQWFDNFLGWKVPQVVNVTEGTGAYAGTQEAITAILDAVTGGQSDVPGLVELLADLTPDHLGVQVLPEESSSDFCSEYAGKVYGLDEAGDIPFFPAHPGCIHSIEVVLR